MVIQSSTIEEQRLDEFRQHYPQYVEPFEQFCANELNEMFFVSTQLDRTIHRTAKALFELASSNTIQHPKVFDDRPLYWGRLVVQQFLRSQILIQSNLEKENGQSLLRQFDQESRFFQTEPSGKPKIVLTCFDPFLLDKDIRQSNPSAVIAFTLATRIKPNWNIAIYIFPVRFDDFDNGCVERRLQKIFLDDPDLVVTLSMGRREFDLDRFPANRRSARALDNLNRCGTDGVNHPQCVPNGPEFIEFALPVEEMLQYSKPWSISDNRRVVTTTHQELHARSLDELQGLIAVSGSGGGFLSNEISYRTLLLREKLGGKFPLGHLHVPRITSFDATELDSMCRQAEAIIASALQA